MKNICYRSPYQKRIKGSSSKTWIWWPICYPKTRRENKSRRKKLWWRLLEMLSIKFRKTKVKFRLIAMDFQITTIMSLKIWRKKYANCSLLTQNKWQSRTEASWVKKQLWRILMITHTYLTKSRTSRKFKELWRVKMQQRTSEKQWIISSIIKNPELTNNLSKC